MAIGDINQVRIVCRLMEQVSFNIRHYVVSAVTGTEATPTQKAFSIASALNNFYKDLLAVPAEFRGVGVQKIFPDPIGVEGSNIDFVGPGLAGPEANPTQTAGLIRLLGAIGGRRGRGRAYIPFPAEVDNDATAVPTTNYVQRLQLLADRLAADVVVGAVPNTTTLSPVVVSRVGGMTFTSVTGATASVFWATQRRRTRGRSTDVTPF